EQHSEREPEFDARRHRPPEDLLVAGLVEPKNLGVEGRKETENDDDGDDNRGGNDDDSAARATQPVTGDPDHGCEAYQRVTSTALTVGTAFALSEVPDASRSADDRRDQAALRRRRTRRRTRRRPGRPARGRLR